MSQITYFRDGVPATHVKLKTLNIHKPVDHGNTKIMFHVTYIIFTKWVSLYHFLVAGNVVTIRVLCPFCYSLQLPGFVFTCVTWSMGI